MGEISGAGLGGRDLVQVFLPCADLNRSKAFYAETLGLRFLFETNGMAFFQLGNTRLMLGELREGQAAMGGGGLYFDAPDLPELVRNLEERGASFRGAAQLLQEMPQGNLMLQSLLDPDGNLIALMGTVKPDA